MNTRGIYNKNDNWETPIDYWKIINPFIPKDLIIHDPFYMNGNSYHHWKKIGREIIHEDKDFFLIKKNNKKEIYVSSPPYSKMKEVLKHLFYLDKPFIMLIPINKVGQIKIQKILKNNKLQLIISPIYKGFISSAGEQTRCPSQYFCFLCYKVNLDRDLLFL